MSKGIKRTKKQPKTEACLTAYTHPSESRTNNPPVGLVSTATDRLDGKRTYQHDPHIDPQLSWAGKAEGLSFEVPDVSLHVHERIDSRRLARALLKKDAGPKQGSLFEFQANQLPLSKAVEFYAHGQKWTNRLIAGDSLLVMNSLLTKEGMAGKVQMIYVDPPYGIKYNSNFQPFVSKRSVSETDADSDLPAEPETIQAFRDTWELGIHSYLSYLKNRLHLAKELLCDSGSCFIQINDQNLHHVKEIAEEVFGKDNFVTIIPFRKTTSASSNILPAVSDFLIWFANKKSNLKYRQLFVEKQPPVNDANFRFIEQSDGARRAMTIEERRNPYLIPTGSRIYRHSDITSPGPSGYDDTFIFEGIKYRAGARHHWKTNLDGMAKLVSHNRIARSGSNLAYVRFFEDFPYIGLENVWNDTATGGFGDEKIYVVQTIQKVLQRCLLMTTDPGDLVLDITCGSGTTAFVAEQWGRRWITCDTSRVAITLTKQRLMTATFDQYKLAVPNEGLKSGFIYKKVSHVTLGSIANNEPPAEETLYDQPLIEKDCVRVAGPFTVEAVPSLRTKPFDGNLPHIVTDGSEVARSGETANQALWREELLATGIRGAGGAKLQFTRIEAMPGTKFLHAAGEIICEDGSCKTALVCFGPDFGPLEQRQVEQAINEARGMDKVPDFMIFAAFHFDPEAAKDIDQIEWDDVELLKVQMSSDLLTADLRKKRSSTDSYWLIGQPQIEVLKLEKGQYKVRVDGFDYYNPISGTIESGNTNKIAMWMLDTDYDEQSLYPEQTFFPMPDSNRDWSKIAKALGATVDEDALETFVGTESLPFAAGPNKKIAVKIVDDRGIESFVVRAL